MYRTYEDLEHVIQQDKPLRVVKTVFEDFQKGIIYKNFIATLKKQYKEKYGNCLDCLVYIDVVKELVLDKNGNSVTDDVTGEPKTQLVYVYEDKAYIVDEEGNKVLTEEAKEKIANNQIKPDLDSWIKWHLEGKEELGIEPFVLECDNCDNSFVNFIKPYLLDKLSKLADEKQSQAEALIAEKKNITDKQIQRYKTKYDLAQQAKANDDYSVFDLEAKLTGMTAEDLVNLILSNGEEWRKAIDNFILLIEAYRIKAQSVINSATTINQIFTIEKLLDIANTMGPNTTKEEIEQLFTEYSEA